MTRTPALALAQAILATAVGLIGLPAILDSGDRSSIVIWLVAAAVVGAWLLGVGPVLAEQLASPLRDATGGDARLVARALVAVGEAVVVPLILRRPTVVMAGDGLNVEAAYAAVSVGLLLGTLVVLYREARPVVERVALEALDALIATRGTGDWLQPEARTAAALTASTLGAGRRAVGLASAEATVAATVPAPRAGSETTRLATETVPAGADSEPGEATLADRTVAAERDSTTGPDGAAGPGPGGLG